MDAETFGTLSKKILIIGVIALLSGIAFFAWLINESPLIVFLLGIGLLWVVAVGIIITVAYLDEISVELKQMYAQQTEELKLLRAELGLLRYDLGSMRDVKGKKK